MVDKKMFASRIDANLLKELKHLSVDLEKPIADLLEEAVTEFVEKHKKKPKGSSKRETS